MDMALMDLQLLFLVLLIHNLEMVLLLVVHDLEIVLVVVVDLDH
jgi:hypothetical protein